MKIRSKKIPLSTSTFVGIDPSLTSTGMGFISPTSFSVMSFGDEVLDRISIERQLYHLRRVVKFCEEIPSDSLVVCIEALQVPFNRRGTGKFIERTELVGMMKYHFAKYRSIYVLECAATTRRKFLQLSGRSSSSKKEVVQAVALLLPEVQCKNSDEADALTFALMSRLAYNRWHDPLWSALSLKQREAVTSFRAANIHLLEV